MTSSGKITTDHREIRDWTERRGGRPARVKATADSSGGGLLRIDFPDRRGEETLESISWEDFFSTFDDRELAFLYQERTADGHESRFAKFVERDSATGQHTASASSRPARASHAKPARKH